MASNKNFRDGEEQEKSKPARYMYSICPTCREKANINAYYCPNCGNRTAINANTGEYVVQEIHGSRNPEDYIYGIMMNDFKQCPGCHITKMSGKPCEYVYCYATEKGIKAGECGKCGRYNHERFSCCHRKYGEAKKGREKAGKTGPLGFNGKDYVREG
jgi:hypothetical protein